MGSKGDSYDSTLAETIGGLCKTELIHRRDAVRSGRPRLLEPIGYVPPAEFEANYFRRLEQQTMSV